MSRAKLNITINQPVKVRRLGATQRGTYWGGRGSRGQGGGEVRGRGIMERRERERRGKGDVEGRERRVRETEGMGYTTQGAYCMLSCSIL